MKLRSIAALAALAATLTAGAAYVHHTSPATKAAAVTSSSDDTGAAGGSSAPHRDGDARDFHLGASFTYSVDSARTVVSSPKQTVAGQLTFVVVGAADGNAKVRAELRTNERSSGPFYFVMQPDGAIESFHFLKSMRGEERRTLRALVASLELVTDRPGSTTWSTHETDGSGAFAASYARSGSDVVKTKLRYDAIRTPRGLVTPGSIGGTFDVQSTDRIAVDASGWPASMTEHESLTMRFSAGAFTSTADTTAKLTDRGENEALVGSFDADLANFDPDVDAAAEDFALAQRNADLALVKGATFKSLADELGPSAAPRDRHRTVARMNALLRTNPEAIADARKTLLAKDTDPRTAGALAGSLGQAGTPAAQHALAEALASDDVAPSTKTNAAVSLGLTDKPTTEAKEALEKASTSSDSSLSDTSTLGLGNLAKRAGPDASTDIITNLLAKLAAATTAADKALALDALGNSGDARALDAILGFVSAPEDTVRAAALNALRFESGDRVVAALAGGSRDPSTTVRRAALSAIGQQPISSYLAILGNVLHADADANVRLAAVRVLARSVNSGGDVEALLVTATKDADPKVRDAATQALSKQPTSADDAQL